MNEITMIKNSTNRVRLVELRRLSILTRALLMLIPIFMCNAANAGGVIMFVGDTLFDYDTDAEIHLLEPDGTAHRRILPRYPMRDASIHPDGTRIAYSLRDRGELREVGIDGRKDRRLIRFNGKEIDSMSWSPNGRYLAYSYKLRAPILEYDFVGIYDAKRKRAVATYRVSKSNEVPGIKFDSITSLDWSPNSRYLALVELEGTFTGIAVHYERFTYVLDTRRRRWVKSGQYPNYGFYNNNELIVPLTSGEIGTINFSNDRTKPLLNLGPLSNIRAIARHPRSKQLLVEMTAARESFNTGLTGLSALTGDGRSGDLKYDFMRVNLNTGATAGGPPRLAGVRSAA